MSQIPEISAEEARKRLDAKDALFVDIRRPSDYAHAHVPGAIQVTDANVAEFVERTEKAKPVIVYCYHGNSSLGATAYFLQNGFTDVRSLTGGFEGWRQTNPTES